MANENARRLRKDMTDAERRLWRCLRLRRLDDCRFRRQHPIGPYIVDFVCFQRKLIIELDGGRHNEPETIQADAERSLWLEAGGYKVIRYWNSDVLQNADGVVETILQNLAERPAHNNNGNAQ